MSTPESIPTHLTCAAPIPESTLTLCRLYPPVRDVGFGLWRGPEFSKIFIRLASFLVEYSPHDPVIVGGPQQVCSWGALLDDGENSGKSSSYVRSTDLKSKITCPRGRMLRRPPLNLSQSFSKASKEKALRLTFPY